MAVELERMHEWVTGKAKGKMETKVKEKEVSLSQMLQGEQGTIVDTPSDPLLASLGFRNGKTVMVTAKEVFKGPLICCVDGRNVAIGRDVAKDIVIKSI